MKYILTFFFLMFWFVTPAIAQVFCFEKKAQDIEKSINKHNEEFLFSAITRNGTPISIYKGKDTFTIIFITKDGIICTGPDFVGSIVQKLKLNNEKGI